MITGRMKAFRAIKDPMRIGFFAFFSVTTRATKVISARVSTSRNGVDAQPKFCPKDVNGDICATSRDHTLKNGIFTPLPLDPPYC